MHSMKGKVPREDCSSGTTPSRWWKRGGDGARAPAARGDKEMARTVTDYGTLDDAARKSAARVAVAHRANASAARSLRARAGRAHSRRRDLCGAGHGAAVVERLSDALHLHTHAAPAASGGRVADGVGRLAAAHGEHFRDAGLRGAAAARAGAAGTIGGELPCAGAESY